MMHTRFPRFFSAVILLALLAVQSGQDVLVSAAGLSSQPADQFITYLPIVNQPQTASGTVTVNGAPAAGEVITLLVTGDGWTTYQKYNTVTDASGRYVFTTGVPRVLNSAVQYEVMFVNPSTTSYNGKLRYWSCWVRRSSVDSDTCDMDIADVSYIIPANGATVNLPTSLVWNKRATTTDSYGVSFENFSTGDPFCSTGTGHIGYTSTFFMANLSDYMICPIGQSLVSGTPYRWRVYIQGPDGMGDGWYGWKVTLIDPASAPAAEAVPDPLMGRPGLP